MKNKGIIVWHNDYLLYEFGPTHPFRAIKYKHFIEAIKKETLKADIVEILELFSMEKLAQVMDETFLQELLTKEQTPNAMIDPGTPAFPNMVQYARRSAQGTYIALKEILAGNYTYGFNCLGGFHHAKPDSTHGGCVLNDLGIAIRQLRQEGMKEKIAIIDVDFHPHDGTVAFFLDDPKVFCASIHDKGWFGFDDSIDQLFDNIFNIGLSPTKQNPEYLELLEEKLLPQVRTFEPDLLILVNGVDGHVEDPVTYYNRETKSISLSTELYKIIAEKIATLALECTNGRILGVGSGGYHNIIAPKVWIQSIVVFDALL